MFRQRDEEIVEGGPELEGQPGTLLLVLLFDLPDIPFRRTAEGYGKGQWRLLSSRAFTSDHGRSSSGVAFISDMR